MKEIKAIETFYNDYRFRSRAEARWAVFFDACKIQYMYEPEGFKLSDGTMYLPDFYLPESKTYFEVKGIMSDADMHKIKQLQKDLCVSIAIGYADMTFQSSDNFDWGGDQIFEIADKDESFCVECPNCKKIFFMANTGYYGCQCCGYYEGDSIFGESVCGDGTGQYSDRIKVALNKAKQARFEHGEHGGKKQYEKYSFDDDDMDAICATDINVKRCRLFIEVLLSENHWKGLYSSKEAASQQLPKDLKEEGITNPFILDCLEKAMGFPVR